MRSRIVVVLTWNGTSVNTMSLRPFFSSMWYFARTTTEPRPLAYTTPAELLERLRPGVDGVTLAYAQHRATFLPQVWERVPEPARFLELLCEKMGLPADAWRRAHCEVSTYQVEVIEETAGRLGSRPD